MKSCTLSPLFTWFPVLCYRFINWQAAAIKSIDSGALVSVGVWNPKSNTDQFGMVNHYTDECLVKAGGKANVSGNGHI